MIGRRALAGISLLCVLAFCALAAPSAFATKGTTAYTCVKVSKEAQFEDAHCTKGGSGAGYRHEEIEPGKNTGLTISNKNTAGSKTEGDTAAVLNATLFNEAATITCTNMHGGGSLTNTAGPPMSVSGTLDLKFLECDAKVGTTTCEVIGAGTGVGVYTGKVSFATPSTPTEVDEVKFEEDGEVLSKFKVKCPAPINKEVAVELTGTTTANISGATLEFTKKSTEGNGSCEEKNGLCANSQIASFETKITLTQATGEPGISITTTET